MKVMKLKVLERIRMVSELRRVMRGGLYRKILKDIIRSSQNSERLLNLT